MVGVILLAFIAGAILIFGVNLLYADAQQSRLRKLREQVQQESRLVQRERAHLSVANKHLYELAALSAGDLSQRQPLRERLELFFEQAGVRLRPSQVVMLAVAAAGLAGGGAWLLTRDWLVALLAGLASSALPSLYVIGVRRRRMHRLLVQLPEAFDLIGRMMHHRPDVSQAMQSTAEDGSPPLSEEFGYCSDQQQLGMSPQTALQDLARRTGLLELKIFVLAVSIHRQTGGNLSDLLEKLSDVIRGRLRTQGLINSLTAEGRLQVYVLTALPILTLIVMSIISPQYAQQLYDRPWLLASTAASVAIGWYWMRRIVNFTY